MQPYSKKALTPVRYLCDLIGITSQSGVGSSTALDNLHRVIGDRSWRFVSGGDLMRREASNRGMSLECLLGQAKFDSSIDGQLDKRLGRIGRQNHTVIESRLAHLHCQTGFRVLLICPSYEVRAERSDKYAPEDLEKRDKDDHERYARLYPGSMWEDADFDFVLSTQTTPKEEVAARIIEAHRHWKNSLPRESVEFGPAL